MVQLAVHRSLKTYRVQNLCLAVSITSKKQSDIFKPCFFNPTYDNSLQSSLQSGSLQTINRSVNFLYFYFSFSVNIFVLISDSLLAQFSLLTWCICICTTAALYEAVNQQVRGNHYNNSWGGGLRTLYVTLVMWLMHELLLLIHSACHPVLMYLKKKKKQQRREVHV